MFQSAIRNSTFILFLVASGLLLAGCDTGGSASRIEFRGQVTDDQGFAKAVGTIEGATVTAADVSASGRITALSGEAVTDAQGQYNLTVNTRSDIVLLRAERSGFDSRVLAYVNAGGTIDARPMTLRTTRESDVYVEAVETQDREYVTVADVSVHMTTSLAVNMESGNASAAAVGAAIAAAARTEAEFAAHHGGVTGARERDKRRARLNAFAEMQTAFASTAKAEERATAFRAFEEAVANAYAAANVSADVQARARLAHRNALDRLATNAQMSSQARLQLQKQSEVLAAMAASQAIETHFRAQNAAEARLNALIEARNTLLADLRAATSANAITNAKTQYRNRVETELAVHLEVSGSVITASRAGLTTVRQALQNALTSTSGAREMADAHAAFYASAETAVEGSLTGVTTAQARFAASILTLLVV
jgi:hypothetical protein